MTILVDPAVVAETEAALGDLAGEVPELPRAPLGSTGAPGVDDALTELLEYLNANLQSASTAVGALGEGAAQALETMTTADQSVRFV